MLKTLLIAATVLFAVPATAQDNKPAETQQPRKVRVVYRCEGGARDAFRNRFNCRTYESDTPSVTLRVLNSNGPQSTR